MPEKDKDKKTKEVSETDTLIKKAKLVKEAPTGEEWKKVISGGKEVYVKRTKKETPPTETPATPPPTTTTKIKYKGPPPSNKPKPKPKPKDTPKEEDFTEEVVTLEEKKPKSQQTSVFGDVQTYENIDPAKQWGANYGITTIETPDAEGRYTNTSRKYNIDKEGREIVYDLANPLNSFKDGKFTPTYTGRTIEDIRKEYTTQQIETPRMSGVYKRTDPNYQGSLMMPGTKATRIAGGGAGEFNQTNVGKIPGALSTAPVGYIEQKYDTQGKPIYTPNQGVQFDEKNLAPLRKGEMEVGKMYDIPTEGPVEIKGNFAKGGSVKAPKMKKYAMGGEIAGYNYQGQPVDRYGDVIENEGMTTEDVGKASLDILMNAAGKLGGSKSTTSSAGNESATANTTSTDASATAQSGSTESGGMMNKLGGKSALIGAATDLGVAGAGLGAAYIDSKNKDARGRFKSKDAAMGSSALKGTALGTKLGANPALVAATGGMSILAGAGLGALGGGIYGAVRGKKDVESIKESEAKMKSELAKANTLTNQQRALANREAGILEGNLATPLTEGEAIYNEKDELINPARYAKGGVTGAAKMMYAKGGTIVGKGGPKDDAIFTKANEKGIAPGSFIVPAENNEKAKGIRAALFGGKNKKAQFKKGGETESNVAVSNGEHLFTPKERKKIINYLGEEILEELAPNAEENNEEMNMGGQIKYGDGGKTRKSENRLAQEKFVNDYYDELSQNQFASMANLQGKRSGPDIWTPSMQMINSFRSNPNLDKLSDEKYAEVTNKALSGIGFLRKKYEPYLNEDFTDVPRQYANGGMLGNMTDRTNMREYVKGGLIKRAEGTPNDGTNPKNKTTIPVGRLTRIDKDEDGKETRTEYPYYKKTKTVSALRKEVLEKRNDGSEVLKVQMPDGTWKVKMVKTFETIKKADGGLVEGEGDPLIPYNKSIVPLVNKTDSAAFQAGYMEANPRNTIVDRFGNVAYPSGMLRRGSDMMKDVSENNKKFALEMNSPEKAGAYASYLSNQEKYKKGVSAGMNLTNQDVIDIAKEKIERGEYASSFIKQLSPLDQKRIENAVKDLSVSKKAEGGIIPENVASQKRTEQIQDSYAGGGYVVQRSSDREGKTHKVTGPDGTVKYFGDSNLGQHPKDPERKKAFYARHKENLDNNPFFRAYARETWAEGGTTGDGLSKEKAKIMLHEGMANGKPITEQQRKYFGWVAGGSKEAKMDGGSIRGYANGTPKEGVEIDGVTWNGKNWIDKSGNKYTAESGKKFTDKYNQLVEKTKSNEASRLSSEINVYSRKLNEAKASGNTAEVNRLQSKINELKGGLSQSTTSQTAPTTTTAKSGVKAPSVKGGKKGKKTSQSLEFVPKMAGESEGEDVIVPGDNLSPNERTALIAKEKIDAENAKKLNESAMAYQAANPTSPKAPRKGLMDYAKRIDPGAAFSAYQIMQGSKLLKSGQRPEDVSKIDPAFNAAVERAQRDATFGYTPEQAAMLDQKAINALNDARFSGRNLAGGSAGTAFQQERQAINQGWSNALQLKSADQQLRMQKQQYADQAVKERADFLDMQRRRAFGDAMDTYNINQESGSALVGAGVRNAIGAFRYQKELDAQERAAKIAGTPIKTT